MCPVCGKSCGFSRIGSYARWVIELCPYREGMVMVARFRCGDGRGTFSMLPYQLVPYQRYTLESMVYALLLWRDLCTEEGRLVSGYAVSESLSAPECRVTSSLLYAWLLVCRDGLRRRHSFLRQEHGLGEIENSNTSCAAEGLEEIHEYCSVLNPRGPPRQDALKAAAKQYGMKTGGFLLGVPSQGRRSGIA